MNDALHQLVSLHLLALTTAILAAVSCGILGNFLVLRRMSLMGDAISHSVLPGLVIAFLIAGSRAPGVMFLGAAAAGIATVVLVELVKRLGRVDPDAAMGVVFSVLFALGVVLIERAAARQVDLDADCVLYGDLEALFWVPPQQWDAFWTFETWAMVPPAVWTQAGMAIIAVIFVVAMFKELRIASFDGPLATTLGYHAGMIHAVLMVIVAAATVAAFEAVGSILVVAMLICPAAAARLLTDRLTMQIILSVLIAIATAIIGYIGAGAVPALFGADAVRASGAIAVVGGLAVAIAATVSPTHGVLARAIAHRRLARDTAADDLLAGLYRAAENRTPAPATTRTRGFRAAAARGLVSTTPDGAPTLTDRGRIAAAEVIRRHRLWESYLVETAGMAPDHVHAMAERLEHIPVAPDTHPTRDPHGRIIPPVG